jgi:dTDP-4-amino-4,6-dideoxygalactose transaminase
MEIRRIPFLPLGGLFEQDDIDECQRVLANAALSEGGFFPLPEEEEFQSAFAKFEGAKKCVAVNSCGSALDLCMMALNIGPGDEVIVPPLTFVCTATCAAARGAKIVFADIDPDTLCLDPRAVESKITTRTRAVIPVHFAGLACDIEAFDALGNQRSLAVIYDSAHAVGARYKGQAIGSAGKASCYSFQANKNMSTLGEGGAIATADEAFAELVRQKKTFGYVYGPQLRVVTIGFNYRMTKPQLAVGLTQLAKVERIISLRLERFSRMQDLLADVEELILPAGIAAGHASHLYVVRLDTRKVSFTRDALVKELKGRFGVQASMHYPAVWGWEAFQSIEHDRSDCPIAERACDEVVSLPIFPRTSFDDLQYIKDSLVAAIHSLKRRSP